MLNNLKNRIEKDLREYLDYKLLFESKIKEFEDTQEDFAKQAMEKEFSAEEMFDKRGFLNLIQYDLALAFSRLFYTYEAYKDIVEIPQEVEQTIQKELNNQTEQHIYSSKGELVNKELYEQRKQQFLEINQKLQNQGAL